MVEGICAASGTVERLSAAVYARSSLISLLKGSGSAVRGTHRFELFKELGCG